MTVEKRFNFRIYPTKEQETQIQKNFGCVRFVYNLFLGKQLERYQSGKGYLGLYDTTAALPELKRTPSYEWLQDADASSLSYALCDLDNAYKSFFKRVRQGNVAPGFPKFKSKKNSRQSYRCKNRQPSPGKISPSIEMGEKSIKLPKLGWIECKISQKIEGRILSASVIQKPSGKYFVSVNCTEYEPQPLPKTGKSIGLHLGIQSLIVTSGGERFENHRFIEKSQQKLLRLHRQLSRKPSGSNNHEKARIKYAKAFEQLTNQKADMLHKLTTQLVREYDFIAVHDVSVREMLHKHIVSSYLRDTSWSDLVRKLTYKCQWYGKTLVKVEESFPSAQLCASCGFRNTNVRRRGDWQEWDCPKCGAQHERGVNSAVNILREALDSLEQPKVDWETHAKRRFSHGLDKQRNVANA